MFLHYIAMFLYNIHLDVILECHRVWLILRTLSHNHSRTKKGPGQTGPVALAMGKGHQARLATACCSASKRLKLVRSAGSFL